MADFQFSSNGDLSVQPGSIGSPSVSISSNVRFSGSYGNPFSSLYTSSDNSFIELSISTLGYENISVEWDGGYWFGNNNGTHQWLLSADSGSGFGGSLYTQNCSRDTWQAVSYDLGNSFNDNANVRIRITSNVSNSRYVYLDNLVIKGSPIVPDLTAPTFQNPQTDMSVNIDDGVCGAVVNYTIPSATDDQSLFTGNLSGYTNLGIWNNHSYYYSNGSANATTAIQNALDLGGHLVTINSQAENDWLDAQLGGIWIGLTDASSEGNFEWVTGEPVDFDNWNGGEPNDWGSGEDYTEMYSNGRWNDLRGTNNRRYVVEFQTVTVVQTQGLPPGSLFPVGTTTNTFVATDESGNSTSHTFTITVVDNQAPKISQWTAEYYSGRNFETYQETLTVDELNYSWGSGPPESSLVGNNQFSIRFQGVVKAPQTGTYTFYTNSDDGVRLWVNGIQLIDDWRDHGVQQRSGTIDLTADELASVRLDYYENGGGAVVRLEWVGPGQARDYVRNTGDATCQDLVLDLNASGSGSITVDDVDPGYIDECGIGSRTLSRTDFDCNDVGDNVVTLTVEDVNGNVSTCDITLTVNMLNVADNSLAVSGDSKCQGEIANFTVHASETGVVYSLYRGAVKVGSSANGTGADLPIAIPSSELNLGDNIISVKAAKGVCELDLVNTANVRIYATPVPVGIYHD
ncbi:PA14 domain-containing protein [Marinifilum caeruleilacunae]|nr:PA14 domain-containing protein [Marinifilum caeruleilacunae]